MRRLVPSACPPFLAALVVICIPQVVLAQSGCRYAEDGNDVLTSVTAPRGERITYISNPHFLCEDGVQIWADSAVAYSTQAMSILIGSVRYLDRDRELTSDQARYFSDVGRLQAQGRLRVTNHEDGSVIENGDLVYLRQAEYRDDEEMVVTTGNDGMRPRAMVRPAPADSAAADAPAPAPYTVVADRLVLRGAGYFNATGTVEIDRDSLRAFADSAEYEGSHDRLVLVRTARVESGAYELVGRTITLGTAEGAANEIEALRDGVLTGDDLRLTAPRITLFVTDGAMERLLAEPIEAGALPESEAADATRPVAVAENFELTGNTIEVVSPAEVVERIVAAGDARSVSHARDSLNVAGMPELALYDWLEGDTVSVMLRHVTDSARAGADTLSGGQYEVERVVARVQARSLYRLPPEDSTAVTGVDAPAVHYVMGDEITIVMHDGEVDSMRVVGQTHGVHLEPLRAEPEDASADTSAAPGSRANDMTLNQSRRSANDPEAVLPPGASHAQGGRLWSRR